jgi:hypothetical protein
LRSISLALFLQIVNLQGSSFAVRTLFVCLVVGSLLAAVSTEAQVTFVVDDASDAADQTLDGSCNAQGSADCTLRAAIEESNNLPGTDTINFAITPDGTHTITLGSALPAITDTVIIDGTTQGGYSGTPIIEINAASGGGNTLSLQFGSSGSRIRGLVINRSPGRAIRILGSSNNIIAGNFLGTNVAGTAALGNDTGVYIGGSTVATDGNVIGGTNPGDGNLISGNNADGIQINGGTGGASNNRVEGNYIGVDVSGTLDLGNGSQGVAVFTGSGFNTNNVIGGTAAGAGNVISGNDNMGMLIADTATTGTLVQGNKIGTNAAGDAGIGNFVAGIHFDNPTSNNTIGGTVANAGNLIAYNWYTGIQLTSTVGNGNEISGNSIHSNNNRGIDLLADGSVTPNDIGDGDTGPNNLQNFPVLSAAATNGFGSAHFAGSLNSTASTNYRVEFFSSSAADPSGYGEGETYLGFTNVTTDGSGYAGFGLSMVTATPLVAGEYVTATATNLTTNDTSEFSKAIVAVVGAVVTSTTDAAPDGTMTSVAALIAAPGPDGLISLREAITAANNTAGAHTIYFGIPLTDPNHYYYPEDGSGGLPPEATTKLDDVDNTFDSDYPAGFARSWYRISPNSNLPAIVGNLTLDASTQPGYVAGGPVIELTGASAGVGAYGFAIVAPTAAATVRGFVINQYTLEGITASVPSVTVQGNYIGTDVSGTLPRGNGTSFAGAGVYLGGIGSQVGGLTLADRNIISGNVNDGLWLDADDIVVQGNYVGTDVTGTTPLGNGASGIVIDAVVSPTTTNVTVGGLAAGAGNVVSGNSVNGIAINGVEATANNVLGNIIGLDATGDADLGNTFVGVAVSLGATGNFIGDTGNGRNIISGNNQYGVRLVDGGTSTNRVQNNYIGLDITGDLARPNGVGGVCLEAGGAATGNIIGGTAVGLGNVISGNNGFGIDVRNSMTSTLIAGNIIGRTWDGSAPQGNTGAGILITSSNNNTIGGTGLNDSNTIASNGGDGIAVTGTSTGNTILGNSIYGNTGLGIDLADNAVSENDLLDADTGPNTLLNFPDPMAAIESGGNLTAYFKLDVPAGSYRIEFFENSAGADPTGNGEGQVLVGTRNVNHPGGGSVDFNHTFVGAVGDIITATATACTDAPTCNAFGDTSEFGDAATAVPTAVKLASFSAVAGNGEVNLYWRTGSELNNLGFHLYRSLSADGSYEKITSALIPGLGSSPVGASYSYQDRGLTNGTKYFYRLEDIETTGLTELHGPVSATPEEDADSADEDDGPPDDTSRITCGDPSTVSMRVLERDPNGAVIELITGGFFATPQDDGTVRLEVPGFEDPISPGSIALPVKRTWLEAVAGRRVRIASVQELERTGFAGLRPTVTDEPEIVASRRGTVRVSSRKARAATRRERTHVAAARVVETGFQGDIKKALVELSPFRLLGTGRLMLARRLVVRVSFEGVEPKERVLTRGRGRQRREVGRRSGRKVLVQLATEQAGLHRVGFEKIFAGRRRAVPASSLRLSRLGETVPFHLEPANGSFGPGSTLYFLSAGKALNPYANEAVYELEWGPGGEILPVQTAEPQGTSIDWYLNRSEWEDNRFYQAALLDAPSLWHWDMLVSPVSKTYPFIVSELVDAPAKLEIWLQGASDFEATPDHHLRVTVNGTVVGETSWDGKTAKKMEVELAPGLLHEGQNDLAIENVGDTAASYSMVFLDRFALTHTRHPVADAGRFEGSFSETGVVTVGGLGEDAAVIQTSPSLSWVRDGTATPAGLSFNAEAGSSYLAVSPQALLEAKVRRPTTSRLRSTRNRADYLLIGPRELLPAARPLLELRRTQGLFSRAVAIEDLYQEFGYGEVRPEAVKEFLEYVYHHWQSPSLRYVVLFGDATYDGKNYLQTGTPNHVPAYPLKTSYLWTASDPSFAAVNGEDLLPDLAIGRLPAASIDEARALVEKMLTYEESPREIGGPVVLVADNPDQGGDFEADSDEIASMLVDREIEKVYLSQLGSAGTRTAITSAFDRGASLMNYVGHGGIALWAAENVFANADVKNLSLQGRQPIVMTMSCLNGYFHFPYFDALGEALVKAEGKGAIAAFSPSGLSLDAPAHRYHVALVEEITSGRHTRLGDAVLAAQRTYAESGAFPELLAIYHLFGDPALVLR